jgi:hypothetical protein
MEPGGHFARLGENPPGPVELRPAEEVSEASLVEASPKCSRWPLVACAEQCPTVVPFVVLGA